MLSRCQALLVSILCLDSRPPTVVRFVMPVVVLAVDRHAGRWVAHVSIKLFEGVPPLTHRDAPPAPISVPWVFGVAAALVHVCPRIVGAGLALPVQPRPRPRAAARLRMISRKRRPDDMAASAAIALAQPHRFTSAGVGAVAFNYNQRPKGFPRQIIQPWHRYPILGGEKLSVTGAPSASDCPDELGPPSCAGVGPEGAGSCACPCIAACA